MSRSCAVRRVTFNSRSRNWRPSIRNSNRSATPSRTTCVRRSGTFQGLPASSIDRRVRASRSTSGDRSRRLWRPPHAWAGSSTICCRSPARAGRAIARRRVHLNSLVEDVRQEVAAAVADRHIVWNVGALPDVEADDAMLRMVLVNLLSNAVEVHRHAGADAHRHRDDTRRERRPHRVRSRQRRRLRHAIRAQTVRRVPAPAPIGRVRRHRDRARECPPYRPAARRPRVGGRGNRSRRDILFSIPEGASA